MQVNYANIDWQESCKEKCKKEIGLYKKMYKIGKTQKIQPFFPVCPPKPSLWYCNKNNVKDFKGKVKSSQKKAKKRKIETSSDSEDYEEKDLVEDESDDSMKMKTIKPVLDSDSLNLSQEEFITGKSSYGTNQSALLIYGKLRRIESRKKFTTYHYHTMMMIWRPPSN